ncbi:MAG: DUF2125 domain-containing protein [Rhodobiaceae bacterium]|nr:DUF2125 domain-containing protein [Rhodobiaceae bacterium]
MSEDSVRDGIGGEAARGRVSRWGLFLPVAALVLLVALWTGYWVFMHAQVRDGLAAWRAAEQAAGRTYACDRETLSGFPFRFELRCTSLTFADAAAGMQAKVAGLLAVAQAYEPRHIIVELSGPAQVDTETGDHATASWTLLEASLQFASTGLKQVSVIADGAALDATTRDGIAVKGTAAKLAAHARQRPDQTAVAPFEDIEIALRADAVSLDDKSDPWTGALDGLATEVPPLVGEAPDLFRTWQIANGSFDLTNFSLTDGNTSVSGTGHLAPTATGTVSGAFAVGLATARPPTPDDTPTLTQQYLALLHTAGGFLGREAKVGGVDGRMVDITIDDGRVSLGTMQIGVLPPLF